MKSLLCLVLLLQLPLQSYAYTNELMGIYIINIDDELADIINYYYKDNDYVVISKRSFLDTLNSQHKIFGGASLTSLENAINIATNMHINKNNNSIIVYDPEHWRLTPREEQANIIDAIYKAEQLTHTAGFRFGLTTDKEFLFDIYTRLEWERIDFLNMQLQMLVNEDITILLDHVKEISMYAKKGNPNIEIFLQLSLRHTEPSRILKAADIVNEYVDGFMIAYPNGGKIKCDYCTPENLVEVLEGLLTLGKEFEIHYEDERFIIPVSSNDVKELIFDQKDKSLTLVIDELTTLSISIPKELLDGKFDVLVDNNRVEFIQNENATHTTLIVESDKNIVIKGTTVIPEFPYPIIMVISLLCIIIIVTRLSISVLFKYS